MQDAIIPEEKKFILKGTLIAFALLILVMIPFAQVDQFDFLNFDDNVYVVHNPHVLAGLSLEGLGWALTSTEALNWHPLTWISHMIDVEYFGLNAGMHHWGNVLFHFLNTLFLFIFLAKSTRSLGRSAWVAALFAVHPLHVQSVVWIAERKDVLCTFFWMLTMLAYVDYASSRRKRAYAYLLFFFILGLMSKAMIVTLPLVLLLLDYWPLKRFPGREEGSANWIQNTKPLLIEKIPLGALSLFGVGMAFYAQHQGGALRTLEQYPFEFRFSNALITYFIYLKKMIWPKDLSLIYLFSVSRFFWIKAGVTALSMIGISYGAVKKRHQWPYLGVGWFWYLITLLPVIGLVQLGNQAYADRYSYIPLTGIFIVMAWGAYDFLKLLKSLHFCLRILAWGTVAIFSMRSVQETSYWKNNLTLFNRIIRVSPDNPIAHFQLGCEYLNRGYYPEAIQHLEKAVLLYPNKNEETLFYGYYYLGFAYAQLKNWDQAIEYDQRALSRFPNHEAMLDHLGQLFMETGQYQKARELFQRAVTLNPESALGQKHLAEASDALEKK